MSTFATIATIVVHTPIWVWGPYALLLFLGLQRTRDGTVPLWRMLTLPVLVALLAVSNILTSEPSGIPAAMGIGIGAAVGWWIEPEGATQRQSDGSAWLRGEWGGRSSSS